MMFDALRKSNVCRTAVVVDVDVDVDVGVEVVVDVDEGVVVDVLVEVGVDVDVDVGVEVDVDVLVAVVVDVDVEVGVDVLVDVDVDVYDMQVYGVLTMSCVAGWSLHISASYCSGTVTVLPLHTPVATTCPFHMHWSNLNAPPAQTS